MTEPTYEAPEAHQPEAEDRFWSKVHKTETCWLWAGAIGASGYGHFYLRGRVVQAHRLSWSMANRGMEAPFLLRHRCDVSRCVRPEHLLPGTQAQNINDAIERGRIATGIRNGSHTHPERRPRGESHGQARLSSEAVCEIRNLVTSGLSQRSVARRYGIAFQTVSKIVRRLRWA